MHKLWNIVNTAQCTLTKVTLVFKALCILPWFIFKACDFGALALGWLCEVTLPSEVCLWRTLAARPCRIKEAQVEKWNLPALGAGGATGQAQQKRACLSAYASWLTRSQSSLCGATLVEMTWVWEALKSDLIHTP